MEYYKLERWQGQIDWPFKRMDVGDSVLLPPDSLSRPHRAASKCGKSMGKKFKTKTQKNGDILVTRIE